MASKVILLFLLIAGVYAVDLDGEDYDTIVESEDYDLVEEEYEDVDVKARNLRDDMEELDEESMNEVHNFCSHSDHANDPICQTLGRK